MWSQICVRNFIVATFFDEWLEKHVIMRNQSQPSKHLLVFKTSWRRLQHVFSVTILRLPRCLEDVLETSWRRLAKTSWRRLEDILKTSCKTSWKTKNGYAEDVLKTSWRHILKICLEEVLKTYLEDALKTLWR